MIHAVILAGGSGTRFWPASREAWPKQFLAIGDTGSMLIQTAARVLPLCSWERLLVVAAQAHAGAIRRQLGPLPRRNLLLEPRARNTAPAIGLAALEVFERDRKGVMAVLPADHLIKPAAGFRKLIRAACRVARSGALVTLGIRPMRPETGYGYIQAGRKLRRSGGYDVFAVEAFTEKPDRPSAVEYLQSGNYYWNSGMFIFTAEAILQALAQHLPALHEGLMRVRAARKRERPRVLERMFDRIDPISIDYGLMEKAGNIQMLPCELVWSDLGSWAALPGVLPQDSSGNLCLGDVLAVDSTGCVLQAQHRLVACVGLRDMVVVETPDAILVCPIGEAQGVRKIVETLKKKRRRDVL